MKCCTGFRGYNDFVRAVLRTIGAFLIFAIAFGPALLDGCVVGCQRTAATGTAHCHTVATTGSSTDVQAIPRCCQNNGAGLADTTVRGLASTPPPAVIDAASHALAAAPEPARAFTSLLPDLHSTPPTFAAPLRV